MVRHASLGWKLRELCHFKVFAQICEKMRSSTNPPFLSQPATSDPTYGVFLGSPGPKEGIGSIFGKTLKSSGTNYCAFLQILKYSTLQFFNPQFFYTSTTIHFRNASISYHFSSSTHQFFDTPILQHCNSSTLQFFNSSTLQFFNFSFLQYFIFQQFKSSTL